MAIPLGKQGQTALNTIKERSAALTVKTVPIDSIKLWADNPRKNDAAVPKLMKLLQEHGQRSPIVVWDKDNTIYKGNTTWKAAKALGWSSIQIVVASFPSAAAAAAYAISDNKASEWSEWDDNILAGILHSDEAFFGTSNTGFSEKELTGLRLTIEMPEGLAPSDLQGDSEAMGDYLILQFAEKGDFEEFKEMMGLGKQERTVQFEHLRDFLK